MIKNKFYEAPEAELILVKFEENIMSPQNSWDGPATQTTEWGDSSNDNGME